MSMEKHIIKFGLVATLCAVILGGVGAAWIRFSVAIERYPSCLTYQSETDGQFSLLLEKSIGDYLRKNGFQVAIIDKMQIQADSPSTLVQWTGDSKIWLNVCTKNESAREWLMVAQDIQKITLQARWFPEVFLRLNPDLTGCRKGNDLALTYPIDFNEMTATINGVKNKCVRGR